MDQEAVARIRGENVRPAKLTKEELHRRKNEYQRQWAYRRKFGMTSKPRGKERPTLVTTNERGEVLNPGKNYLDYRAESKRKQALAYQPLMERLKKEHAERIARRGTLLTPYERRTFNDTYLSKTISYTRNR